MIQYVFDTNQTIRYRFPTHINDLIMDRSESETSEVFITVVEPGKTSPLHVHHDTEQIFYGIEGAGTIYVGQEEQPFEIKPGVLMRIPAHTWHRAEAPSNQTLRYLCVDCFVGGKPSAEPTWDSHVKEICKLNGWDYNQVKRQK